MSRYPWVFWFSFILMTSNSGAIDTLPYSHRIHPYSGLSATSQGDIRTVGMSGATVGLADTFIAALDNPAGLAMTLDGIDTNFASNTLYDGSIQNFDYQIRAYNFGIALNSYPWGLSFGYVARYQEGQPYLLSTHPNDPTNLQISTREFHISVARVFFKNRLSIGAGFIFGQAENEMNFSQNTAMSAAYHSYAISTNLGILYRLPHRILLGLSYRFPMHYAVNASVDPTPAFPGFFQSVEVPSRFGIGVGWIPNRFFRTDFSLFWIGRTPDTALLRDDTTPIGQYSTVQPRIGLAYSILDYRDLKSTFFCGIHYEFSRVQESPNRVHFSTGIEFNPWILSLGGGIDFAPDYHNYLVSFGVDLIRTMQKLELIPTLPHPPYEGPLPRINHYSDEGLSGSLTYDGEPPPGQKLDPLEIGWQIPGKIQEKAIQFSHDFVDAFDQSEMPVPEQTPPKEKLQEMDSPPAPTESSKSKYRIKKKLPLRAIKKRKSKQNIKTLQ